VPGMKTPRLFFSHIYQRLSRSPAVTTVTYVIAETTVNYGTRKLRLL
jgi:hypothetical protein